MALQLHWAVNTAVGCFHTTEIVLRGWPLADAELRAKMASPVQALKGVLATDGISPIQFLEHLVPLSSGNESLLELSRAVLTKIVGRDRADFRARRYAELVEDISIAFRGELPRLQEKLPVAKERLHEQWATHGPTLLAGIENHTEKGFVVKEAEAFLVHPVTGGGGASHPRYHSFRIEGVAQDPEPALPEVLRMAWMVASLNLIMPRYADRMPALPRTFAVGIRAAIPLVLTTAAELKLAINDKKTLQTAINMWLPDPVADLGAKLSEWWAVYQDTRPEWPLALAALDRVLQPQG
jgi:hypothetical protein